MSASSSRNSSPPGRADEVGLARRVPQPFRELPDQGVAGLVPERVVHELEVVQVHRDHGDPEVGAPGAREGELEQLVEHRAVRQARELVVVREVGDLLLRGLPFGDVEHHALDQLRASLRVGEHDRRVTEPHDAPVAPHEPVLEDERLSGLPAAEVGGDGLVPVLGMEQVRPQVGVLDVLLGADAKEFPDLRAHVGRGHLRVGEVDVDDRWDLLHERPVLRLGLLELAARERQLRDVEHQPEPVPRRAVVPGDQDRVLADPPEPAVAMERAVLDVERLTLGGRPLALGDDTFEIVGMDGRLPTPEAASPSVRGDTEELFDRGTDVDHRLEVADAVEVDHRGEPVDQIAVASLEVPVPGLERHVAPLDTGREEAALRRPGVRGFRLVLVQGQGPIPDCR